MIKILKLLDQYLEVFIASSLFMAFSSLMMINIIMRYVFRDAIPWAEELVLFIFVWFVWFAIPMATKYGNHARVTVIQDLFPKKVKAILNLLLNLLVIILFSYIIVSAIQYLGHSAVRGKTGLLVNYPMWAFYIPAPIGLSLTVYRLIVNGTSDLISSFKPIKEEGK